MSEKELADELKRCLEECAKYEPCMSLFVNELGRCVELYLDTSLDTYGEWIPGEGGDICLLREHETKRVVGVCLPLLRTNLCVGHEGPLRVNSGFRKEEFEISRETP